MKFNSDYSLYTAVRKRNVFFYINTLKFFASKINISIICRIAEKNAAGAVFSKFMNAGPDVWIKPVGTAVVIISYHK